MALAKTLTRIFPTENEIGIHLILTDNDRQDLGTGEQVVISETFKRNIPTNADMSNEVQMELGKEVQAAIDHYKKLRDFYVKPVYQTKVTQIDNNLTL